MTGHGATTAADGEVVAVGAVDTERSRPRVSPVERRPLEPPMTVSAATVLMLLMLGALAVCALALVSAPRPLMLGTPVVAHVAGLLAGYGVTVMILLMARIPALERGVGADRMSRWHGVLGRAILLLILIHGVAATIAFAVAGNISVVMSTADVLGMPGLIAATIATFLFIGIGILSARVARRKLRYETWHAIHLLTYLAIGLSFSHELAGPDLAGHPVIQIAWSCLYTVSFALLVRYRILAPLMQSVRHGLRVEAVIPEGRGVVSVIVRGRHLDELEAEGGQFFRWRFLSRQTFLTAHPFSLSAPATNSFLRLTVKAVGDGTTLVQSLRPGTRVVAEGPYGAMTERRRTRHGVLLIAGGVGITPMRTLFETLTMTGIPVTLIYRAPSWDAAVFRQELEHIAAVRGFRLVFLIGPSTDPRNAMTGANLEWLVPDIRYRDVYICAAPGLSRAARRGLRDAGVARRRIHQEEFAF